MIHEKSRFPWRLALLAALALGAGPAGFLRAADSPAGADTAAQTVQLSQNVTINLINRMVQRGLLSKEDAAELVKLAEADAEKARALAAAPAAPVATVAAASTPATPAAPPDDVVRVTYVPEVVKKQLREEIKQEVMAQARAENWAAPRTLPDWLTRVTLFGDLRVRYEGIDFPTDNATGFGSGYWNYNAINTGAPYDYTGLANPPYTNVDQDRNRVRLRARLGVAVDLAQGFTGGLRIATGESSSPVSQNQTLGAAGSGQGGNFSNYPVWLDRGFIRYEAGGLPDKDLSVSVGRFDNPFFATSVIWADEMGFDGGVVQGRFPLGKSFTPFFAAGLFPVFDTDLNFGTTQPVKFKSNDKWLYGSQLGFNWKIGGGFAAKFGAAYYYFKNVEGRVSSPFIPLTASDVGDTDATRPAFAQRGNTYIALRDITPDATLNNNGTINQWQYFGLATPFHDLAGTMQLTYSRNETFQVAVTGEYVKNLAFDRAAILAAGPPQLPGPVNNIAPNTSVFGGGDTAWMMNFKLGSPALLQRWDWNVNFGYRYLESDSVIDGFNDGDFGGVGGGGTNVKGYIVGGSLSLSDRTWLTLRWLSGTGITGPSFKNDIIQLDLNGKF